MRRTCIALAAAVCGLFSAGLATAAPAPFDGQTAPRQTGSLFLSLPFLLGEVDLATLGVSAAELEGVGLAGASAASAGDGPNMRIVDDDLADCPNAQYTSIQAAVTASGPNDQVKVCPGLYQEQVTIGPGKDGLDLFSQVPRQAVIKAPLIMLEPGDIVRVNGSRDVGIRHFTITGPLPDHLFCSLAIRSGVKIDGGGSAKVWGNHITEIRSTNPALRGCQNGIAVAVGRQFEGQVGQIWLTHNLIDNYQKGGVLVDNAGSHGAIDHNEIVGTITPIIAPNGIQVSRGATADVDHNIVRLNQYSLASSNGTAILLFAPAEDGVTVEKNEVYLNDDGISLYDTIAADVEHNNSYRQTRYDGIYADAGSRENLIAHNKLSENTEHDCHDDSTGTRTAGTANYWIKNKGLTENRPGLCKK